MLPVTNQGQPDYDYMKQFIQIEEIRQSYELVKYYKESYEL